MLKFGVAMLLSSMLLFGPVLGFAIGSLIPARWRRTVLFVGLLLPLAIYTNDLAGTQSSSPGFLGWWITGLIMVAPVIVLAMLLTLGGYLGGVALVRFATPPEAS